jgi:hypothetical protein
MGVELLNPIQFRINNLFDPQTHEKGFYVIPESKIKYVCGKFLERNPGFNSGLFRIKLCCDGVSLSRTKINLLNFSFNLLDDTHNSLSVFDTFILGKF